MPPNLSIVRAALDADGVQVVVNGTSYQGWEKIDIDSDILNPADAFTVEGVLPKAKPTGAEVRAGAPSQPFDDFREGNACDVYVGLDRQMAGVIEEVEPSGNRSSARIKITGYDKGRYIVDSEAKPLKAKKYTIKTLVEALLDPAWGIKNVILSNEDNRRVGFGKKDKDKPTSKARSRSIQPRNITKIDPGQRIGSILDEHTQRLGLTWWMTAGGDLFIGTPNYDQEVAYHFVAYADPSKPSNVEDWSVKRSSADRFSEITVLGQGFGDIKSAWDTSKPAPQNSATARDPDLVERGIVRKLVIVDNDILTKDECQKRADHEMGMRRLKGLTINITIPGFRQRDRMYAIDTLASVKIEEYGIDDVFYVTQRRFMEDRGKQRTQLTLHPKGVWLA